MFLPGMKKSLAKPGAFLYNTQRCDMIAMKREVAARKARVFRGANVKLANWRQVTVQIEMSLLVKKGNGVRLSLRYARESVQSPLVVLAMNSTNKEAAFFMASQIMRITLKAYDHKLIDQAAKQIIETVKSTGAKVSGPVPMPTKVEKVTILRAVHKYKDSREQFEQRTHKRLIDVLTPSQKTIDALQKLDMSAGVYIDVKMK